MDRRGAGQLLGVNLRPVTRPSDAPGLPRPSFPELFERHGPYVWLTLRRLGASPNDLEDLTHDVFVQVFRQLDRFEADRPIKPWLFGFAFRIFARHRRGRARHPETPHDVAEAVDPKPSPVEQLLTRERQGLAWTALDALELNRRAVFVMHELEGCSVPEIAESLEVPLATAYSRLRLAREDFAKAAQRLRSRER